MKAIVKIIGCIFLVLAVPMLFIYLYRMANGNFDFIGLSDLFEYISTMDWTSNFWKMINEMRDAINQFGSEFGKTYNNEWEAFINGIGSFANMMWVAPFKMLYDFFNWIFDIINNIVGFFNFVLNFR